jgi:hypothetical protein
MEYRPPEISPWRRRALRIPPDSWRSWVRLAVWELAMGALVCVALGFAAQFIGAAPQSIVTVFDFTNCYAVPPAAAPCERVAYRAGILTAAMNLWCALLLGGLALWLVWDLWSAAAPRPVTDDFLKLLEDSFARDWRRPRTWPWARAGWAYGFTLGGVAAAVCAGLLISSALSRAAPAPTLHVETSERFRAPSTAAPSAAK